MKRSQINALQREAVQRILRREETLAEASRE